VQFVHVSCFEDRSKNISGLLRAISTLAKKRDDFQCRLVGVGEDFEALSRQAEEMGIKDRFVLFSGFLEGDSLVQAISSADFMVISSHYENLPVVTGEAFSCGIPVVSTDVGDVRQMLGSNCGIITPIEDSDSIVESLVQLIKNPELRKQYGDASRSHAFSTFCLDTMKSKFIGLVEKQLNL